MNTLTIGIYGNSISDCQSLFHTLQNIELIREIQFDISFYDTDSSLLKRCELLDIAFLFLDNNISESDTFVESLRQANESLCLILISQSESVFSLGYKYHADYCWKKPILHSNVLEVIDSLLNFEFLLVEPYQLCISQKGIRKLYYRKLRYIETGNRQLIFHYDNDVISYFGCLSDLEDKLAHQNFFRCNNSYLVNILYIEEIIPDMHRYKIRLITGEELPLSRNKKNELIKLISNNDERL